MKRCNFNDPTTDSSIKTFLKGVVLNAEALTIHIIFPNINARYNVQFLHEITRYFGFRSQPRIVNCTFDVTHTSLASLCKCLYKLGCFSVFSIVVSMAVIIVPFRSVFTKPFFLEGVEILVQYKETSTVLLIYSESTRIRS